MSRTTSNQKTAKALGPVIQGVTLNNFFPKAKMGPVHRLSELRQNP